jgi:hypothetical protein
VAVSPEKLSIDAGGTITAVNRGGEDHTFSDVAEFGGGCIQDVNDLVGLDPVPECAGFPVRRESDSSFRRLPRQATA